MRTLPLWLLTFALTACGTDEAPTPPAPTQPTPVQPPPAQPPTQPVPPSEPGLSVSLAATPIEGPAPLRVTLTATATGYTPDFLWDPGDGSEPVYDQAVLTYTYTAPGEYEATVSVGSSEELLSDAVTITVR